MSLSASSSRRSSLLDQYQHHHHHYNSPSFSSSLLEEIYRSFDDDDRDLHKTHRQSTNISTNSYKKVKINNTTTTCMEQESNHDRLRGVNRFVLDHWINNNNNNKVNFRRHSMAAVKTSAKFNSSSSTSSSESSSGIGGFSSSDTESFYGSSKSMTKPALKPIRTNLTQPEFHRKCYPDEIPAKKKSSNDNKEGNLQRRALKLYGDLKKVKQPISPGGKLASFLNSLFNPNSSKKPKISSMSLSTNGLKCSSSTPSTTSSYSRSCLSKTPSSAGRFERRSVRFCPVSTVIAVDNEYNDVDRKTTSYRNDELRVEILDKHRRVEEVAKELLKNYQHNNINKNEEEEEEEEEDEDEDEDNASCCSSDLFELENLMEIGGEHHRRYCEELPVYETTHFHTNRAIAKGYIL